MFLVTVLFENEIAHRCLVDGKDQEESVSNLLKYAKGTMPGLKITGVTLADVGGVWLLGTSTAITFDNLAQEGKLREEEKEENIPD